MEQQVTVGRIVHYVMPNGEHRPAIVVRVWGDGHSGAQRVQLQVFTDGSNDVHTPAGEHPEFVSGIYWATSVLHQEPTEEVPDPERTWHWPERA